MSSAATPRRGVKRAFFFLNKKQLYICVMGESDPIEKKRSVDDREENGMSFTSSGGWEVKRGGSKERGQIMAGG